MRFFYRIFMHSVTEPPRIPRMKMVVKDNDDTRKQERVVKSTLPPITMRIKTNANGTTAATAAAAAPNEKKQENKIKLSHIIGSSSPTSSEGEHADNNNCQRGINSQRRPDGGNHNNTNNRQPLNTDKSPRSGEKRKLKDDYEFVDEVTLSKLPKAAKSPSSSSMRSPQQQHQQQSPKSVTFNDTVQATRIPLITYVNPVPNQSPISPSNDSKRLRSNDIGSSATTTSSLPLPKGMTTGSSSSTTTTAAAASQPAPKNTTSFAATNDSSRITSGTVPDNNFKQFPSTKLNQQQPPPPSSTQLHTSSTSSVSSAVSAQQISSKQQAKSNTQQLHNNNNKSEKFPNTSTSSSTSLSAKDETAIGNNNRHQQNSSSSNSNNSGTKKKSQHGDPATPKNDFNGNLRHEKNHNVATMLANNNASSVENRIEAEHQRRREQMRDEDKIEYVKNIGLKPIHEVLVVDKNKDVDARRKAQTASAVVVQSASLAMDPSSMLYHKKKKKSKHSKDFPFADVKKKKVDYDIAISSSNVPKAIGTEKDSNGSRGASNDSNHHHHHHHHPDSLKMKFVKVTSHDKNNAKVMVIPKTSSDKDASNGRSLSSSKSPSPPKASAAPAPAPSMPVLSAPSTVHTSGNKSPKGGHSPKVPKLSNFIIKDNSMEIHQISKGSRNSPQQYPKKSPSPPSLTITSTPSGNRTPHPMHKPASGHAQPPKRTQSLTSSGGPPPAKKAHIPLQNQRSMEHPMNKDLGSASPFLQRSYSYDPSVVMGSNYNLPLTPFQFQLATQMMLQKQLQQEWAQAAAAKQASANANPPPAPMVPFFNAPMPQSRSPPVNASGSSSSAKKPVPPLVPPSSLGKYNPVPNLVAASKPRLQEKPPMVEIVRLPPGLDKVEIPHIPVKMPPKANRPPPPTIPLVKIRRASANSTSSTESGDNGSSNHNQRPRDVPAVLDLSSGKPAASFGAGDGKVASSSSQKPLPQLNEISKISRSNSSSSGSNSLIHRQQSASVRSVPNPSALALRNQLPAQSTSSSSSAAKGPVTSMSSMSPSMSPARMSPPAMASFTSKSSNLEKLASKIKEGVNTVHK